MDCEYIETESSDTALLTVAYVMAGVCGLCLLPIFVLLVQASCKRRKQQQQQQQQATSATDQPSDRTNLRNDFYNNYWAKTKITVNVLQDRLAKSIHITCFGFHSMVKSRNLVEIRNYGDCSIPIVQKFDVTICFVFLFGIWSIKCALNVIGFEGCLSYRDVLSHRMNFKSAERDVNVYFHVEVEVYCTGCMWFTTQI